MKHTLLAAFAAVLLASPAMAQSTTVTTTAPAAGATVTIAPEHRTVIKRYVTEKKVRPVTVRERVTVGATLPADVQLETIPADWGPAVSRYRYVYTGNDVVLVEPSSRRVVQIID
jgi:Protein of unknown function (DUF1236)